jgi:hypothetical protein
MERCLMIDDSVPLVPRLRRSVLVTRVRKAARRREYLMLPHARQWSLERSVRAPDIEHALLHGHPVPSRDRFVKERGRWSYCFEGKDVDGRELRVIVAFQGLMLVVTVVRLAELEN